MRFRTTHKVLGVYLSIEMRRMIGSTDGNRASDCTKFIRRIEELLKRQGRTADSHG